VAADGDRFRRCGAGWLVASRRHASSTRATAFRVRDFQNRLGLGLDLGIIGMYVAKSVSSPKNRQTCFCGCTGASRCRSRVSESIAAVEIRDAETLVRRRRCVRDRRTAGRPESASGGAASPADAWADEPPAVSSRIAIRRFDARSAGERISPRLHYRLERWSSGRWFDDLKAAFEWDVILKYDVLGKKYQVGARGEQEAEALGSSGPGDAETR